MSAEPYASIDGLLKTMGPRRCRLVLREVLEHLTRNPEISLVEVLAINAALNGQERGR